MFSTVNLVIKGNYTQICSSDQNCDSSVGLICQIAAGACNCPLVSTTGMCDCLYQTIKIVAFFKNSKKEILGRARLIHLQF